MIEINLLPQELTKEKKKRIVPPAVQFSKLPFQKIAIAIAALLFILQTVLFSFSIMVKKKIDFVSNTAEGLRESEERYRYLKLTTDNAAKRLNAFKAIYNKRVIWSKLLNNLSDSMIAGIWLTDFSLIDKAKKGGVARYLMLSGFASSKVAGETSVVSSFIRSLEKNEILSDYFANIKLVSINRRKYKKEDVMQFKLSCEFKQN